MESAFEPVDFADLQELLEGVQNGTVQDPVASALEQGVAETTLGTAAPGGAMGGPTGHLLVAFFRKKVSDSINSQLELLEEESVGDYVNSFESFQDLHQEIVATDSMERMLGTFQSDLSSISDEIRMLQGQSLQMNLKLQNRRGLQTLMSEYVSSVVVSPQLVRQICEEEINEAYLGYLSELNKKLDHVKQQEMQKLPSCAQSAPELEKLRTKAVARIKDFLLQKVNSLKKPKTNLQILQRNVLVRFKSMTQFLAEHHPAVAEEVKAHYVGTMSAVYLKQLDAQLWDLPRFRTYVTSLQKLELEYAATKSDLLVNEGQSAGRLWDNLGLGRSVQLKDKGNVFSLSGRDAILEQLDKDPIIAHTNKDKVKYYHEQLFRSHQMLLMDRSAIADAICYQPYASPTEGYVRGRTGNLTDIVMTESSDAYSFGQAAAPAAGSQSNTYPAWMRRVQFGSKVLPEEPCIVGDAQSELIHIMILMVANNLSAFLARHYSLFCERVGKLASAHREKPGERLDLDPKIPFLGVDQDGELIEPTDQQLEEHYENNMNKRSKSDQGVDGYVRSYHGSLVFKKLANYILECGYTAEDFKAHFALDDSMRRHFKKETATQEEAAYELATTHLAEQSRFMRRIIAGAYDATAVYFFRNQQFINTIYLDPVDLLCACRADYRRLAVIHMCFQNGLIVPRSLQQRLFDAIQDWNRRKNRDTQRPQWATHASPAHILAIADTPVPQEFKKTYRTTKGDTEKQDAAEPTPTAAVSSSSEHVRPSQAPSRVTTSSVRPPIPPAPSRALGRPRKGRRGKESRLSIMLTNRSRLHGEEMIVNGVAVVTAAIGVLEAIVIGMEVFGKTTQYFLDSLEAFLANSWDSVGLLLMVRIVDFYRKRMQQRKVSCLDSYLDALQLLLWPRLRVVLEANIVSLRKAYQQNLQIPSNSNPHLVTRRFAELAASLYFLSSQEDTGLPDNLQQPLSTMRQDASASA
eukprot:s449_g17.t2